MRKKGVSDYKKLISKYNITDYQVAEWLGMSYQSFMSSSARERYRNLVTGTITATIEAILNKMK